MLVSLLGLGELLKGGGICLSACLFVFIGALCGDWCHGTCIALEKRQMCHAMEDSKMAVGILERKTRDIGLLRLRR